MHINYWREVKRDRFGMIGLVILCAVILLALLAPVITAYQPEDYAGVALSPPSRDHLLGTNDVGQDVWTRLLYGARTSIAIGCGAALLSTLIGVVLGSAAALTGGIYDRILMRLVDALLVIPPVIVVILVAAYLRPRPLILVLLLACFLWPSGARVIRAQVLSLKERLHVGAARTFGAGRFHLLARHIIPDLGAVMAAIAIHDIRRAVFMEAGLSFLGITDPAVISWGKMMHHAMRFTYLKAWQWWLLPPGLVLSLTVTAFSFIGYALEKAINPRLRKGEDHADH